jgi:hypothetical protein
MYGWYRNSRECYVYLVDVPAEADPEAFKTAFRSSEWFLRGWTLQELIAPEDVLFFNQAWTMIGTRDSLGQEISSITGIEANTWDRWNPAVRNLSSLSIARRMSWASRRVCTREEDMAYCLLGIFEINMPLLYGEGGSRAFRRLQLEILKTSDDESIFAWYSFGHLSPYEQSIFGRFQSGDPSAEDELHLSDIVHRAKLPPITHELLAPSPAYFFKSHSIKCLKYFGRLPYTVTNKGLQFSADKRLLATAISTVLDSSGHEITAHVVPLNCFDSAKKTKFCLYISLTVPEKWFDFESSRSSFSRLHPTNLRNPPDEVVLSRKSKTQPRFENTTLLGISVMQTLYLTI